MACRFLQLLQGTLGLFVLMASRNVIESSVPLEQRACLVIGESHVCFGACAVKILDPCKIAKTRTFS